MYLSPQLLFFSVWLVPLCAPLFFESTYIQAVSAGTYGLVLYTIVLFFVSGYFFRELYPCQGIDVKERLKASIDISILKSVLYNLFVVWVVLYVITVIYSGGVPILWFLIGSPKTYMDFGVPTLSGFEHLIRAFVLSGVYLIYVLQDKKIEKKWLVIGLVLIFSAFVLETGRGNGVVMLLHPVAFYFFFEKIGIKQGVIGIVLLLLFFMFLGSLQVARYGEYGDLEGLMRYAENQGLDVEVGVVEALLIPSLMYMAVPLVNLDLNVDVAPLFSFDPFYSSQGLFPSVVRDFVFTERQDYGLLVSASHNVSSFYIPFVRDFGIIGAYVAAGACVVFSAFVYAKAKAGDDYWLLVWPCLFMSLILTFFSLYFTSLVVVFYPFVAKYVFDLIKK